MEEPKASRQKATRKKSRKALPIGQGLAPGSNRRFTDKETHFLMAYLQWSVNHQVDFPRVAIPRFIKATNSGLEIGQVLRRLRYLWERFRPSGVTYEEFLKIGPNALSLSAETVEEFERILVSIPSLDAEPCPATGTLQRTRKTKIGEGDAIAFQPISEDVQQVSIYKSSRRPIWAH